MLFSLFFCTVYYSFIICYLIIYDSVGIKTQDPIISASGNSNVNHSGYLFLMFVFVIWVYLIYILRCCYLLSESGTVGVSSGRIFTAVLTGEEWK